MHTIETATRYQCEICGKQYLRPGPATACEKKGMFTPRYRFGDRVMVQDGKRRIPCIITQTGYERGHHEMSCYVVFRLDGDTWWGEDPLLDVSKSREVAAEDILGVTTSKHRVRKPPTPKKVATENEFWEAWGQDRKTEAKIRKILRQHGDDLFDYYAL